MRLSPLLFLLLAACADPPTLTAADSGTPDAGKPSEGTPPDAGIELSLGQLHPFVEEVSGPAHVLRGRLGAHAVHTATSARFHLEGGFRPLSR